MSQLLSQNKGLGARVRKGARILCPFMFGMGVDDDDDTATNATYYSSAFLVAPYSGCFTLHCRSDTQSNYSQVSGASSNWEDTDYDDRGDRASNATEAHQRQPWQQQQQQQQPSQQPQDSARIPKKVTYAQQLVQSVFPQVLSFFGAVLFPLHAFIREFQQPSGLQKIRVLVWGAVGLL